MSVSRRHSLWAVEIGATVIGGITQQDLVPDNEIRNDATSGEVYNRFVSLVAQNPKFTFTSKGIAAALNASGMFGYSFGGHANGVRLYAQKHTHGAQRAGATSHRQYKMLSGILVPVSITCDYQGDAEIRYQGLVTYDGTNDPVVITDSVSLPSGIADIARFTIGKATVANIALPQIRRLEINFGLSVEAIGAGGGAANADVWPTFASVVTANPSITLRGIDIEWLKSANIPLTGENPIHADTSIYLRKRLTQAVFTPDATEEHIQFTSYGLATVDTLHSASGQAPAETSVTITSAYDGTNLPLVLDTTAAIP